MKTIPMSEYIRKRVAASQRFREALIDEALDAMRAGDREGAMALLEDVAKAGGSPSAKHGPPAPRRRTVSKELVEA